MNRIAIVVLTTLLVAACAAQDPYTGEDRTSRTAIGAATGAIIGAIAGAATGDDSDDRRKRAMIGAGVGALAGASVGAYMDAQARKLQEQLEGTGVSVTRVGDDIILNMPSHVTFDVNSAALNPQFFTVLDSVALVLKEYDKTLVDVAGHTDSTGGRELNMRLSIDRASTVASYLHNRGIRAERFQAVGYGPDWPVASNATVEGRQLNRRVEIKLSPLVN